MSTTIILRSSNNRQKTACPLCGDDSQEAMDAMEAYAFHVPGSAVCGFCAENIANAYSKRHSDKWLTWPNEKASPKRKKKQEIAAQLRVQVLERDKYRCQRCGTHLALRVDHIHPESKGGEASMDNLQTLCQPCNSWKGTRTIDFRSANA